MIVGFDKKTQMAITHTRHCLTGCALGEISGMAIAQNWNNILQTAIGIILAFAFGYGLTFRGARKMGASPNDAMRTALRVDTVSIISMVIIDNTLEWLIPGAINAHLSNILFWWSEGLSLSVAFIFTVPVNRYMMSRGGEHAHQH